MIHLNMSVRVLPGMKIQDFSIPCIPETLQISRHPSGNGHEIQVDDSHHSRRIWFVSDIIEIEFGAERASVKGAPMNSL